MKRHFPTFGFGLVLVSLLLGSTGCHSSKPLTIRSIEKPAVVIQPHFKEVWYRMDRDRTLHYALVKETIDPDNQQSVKQYLLIRVFWQPKGGKTPMNHEALNATFRYIVMNPKAVGMYEGAGFVRINRKAGDKHLSTWVVDGDLRLTEATADFNDNFGRALFRGTFEATLSDAKEFDLANQAHREFFTRSLELGKKVAASQPTTEP